MGIIILLIGVVAIYCLVKFNQAVKDYSITKYPTPLSSDESIDNKLSRESDIDAQRRWNNHKKHERTPKYELARKDGVYAIDVKGWYCKLKINGQDHIKWFFLLDDAMWYFDEYYNENEY